jgi:hypothetical protein
MLFNNSLILSQTKPYLGLSLWRGKVLISIFQFCPVRIDNVVKILNGLPWGFWHNGSVNDFSSLKSFKCQLICSLDISWIIPLLKSHKKMESFATLFTHTGKRIAQKYKFQCVSVYISSLLHALGALPELCKKLKYMF